MIGVATRSLQMRPGIQADPDILPGRRNDQVLEALALLAVLYVFAGHIFPAAPDTSHLPSLFSLR